jgi:NAD(P) transhydrogenase subunit beta
MLSLETAATAAYVVAALLFILALAGLSKHETSRPATLSASRAWRWR